jgi:hypothetical protein
MAWEAPCALGWVMRRLILFRASFIIGLHDWRSDRILGSGQDSAVLGGSIDGRGGCVEGADLAGVTLGKVLWISETGASIPFAERSFGGAMLQLAAAPRRPISPGETEISLAVSVVYKIE